MIIGVISDTHGLLRPEALAALEGSQAIIHAGDIGEPEIIARLEEIAPVLAVRGNVDREEWCYQYPLTNVLEIDNHMFYVLHDIEALDLNPAAAGFSAVIYGHSHRPEIERQDGVYFFNPGSAGRRRFTLPVTTGRIVISGNKIEPEIIHLDIPESRK